MYLTEENIVQHGRFSPHRGKLKNPTTSALLTNPLCGDMVRIDLKIDKNQITDIVFSGEGCLISQAAASLLTGEVKRIKDMDKIKKFNTDTMLKLLGFKPTLSRMQCALLSLKTLQKGLDGRRFAKIVLAGGCFDILHPGHTVFLQKAKAIGDILVVLLESDENVGIRKGKGRPVRNQKQRAKALLDLGFVDKVVMLTGETRDSDYEQVVSRIKPDIIAATKGDQNIGHKRRIARLIGAKLMFVTEMVGNYSSSRILGGRVQ